MTEHEAYLIAKRALYQQLASLEYIRHEEGETPFVRQELVKTHNAIKELKDQYETSGPQGIF